MYARYFEEHTRSIYMREFSSNCISMLSFTHLFSIWTAYASESSFIFLVLIIPDFLLQHCERYERIIDKNSHILSFAGLW